MGTTGLKPDAERRACRSGCAVICVCCTTQHQALHVPEGSTRSRTGASYDPVGAVFRTPRRIMHRRAGTQRPALRVAKAATSAVALCGFLGRVGKGVNAFAFSSCVHRRICSLPSTASKSKVCKFAGQGMRRAGGQGAWRPTLSVVGRRSSRGGLLQLGSSAEDGAGEDEEAAREEAAFESIFDKNAAVLDLPLELFDEDRAEPMTPGSTRTEMPVFMLDVSACPGGVVPLHIFEMRYRQMFNDIGTKDNRFGMLVSDPTTGKPCKYGAVMECAQRKLLPDGRQYVLNQAVERFRVLKMVKSVPYTVMEVEVGIPDNEPFEGEPSKWGAEEGTLVEELEEQVFSTVNSVVELMNKLSPPADPSENRTLSEWFLRYSPKAERDAAEGDGEVGADDIKKKEDERRMNFSFAVSEMIAMAPHTKQLLLQSRSTAYRLMATREILVKAQKELAAKSSLKDTLG